MKTERDSQALNSGYPAKQNRPDADLLAEARADYGSSAWITGRY